MRIFYKIGVTIGIFVVYLLYTFFVGWLYGGTEDKDFYAGAYIGGLIAFMTLAIVMLQKFGMWT